MRIFNSFFFLFLLWRKTWFKELGTVNGDVLRTVRIMAEELLTILRHSTEGRVQGLANDRRIREGRVFHPRKVGQKPATKRQCEIWIEVVQIVKSKEGLIGRGEMFVTLGVAQGREGEGKTKVGRFVR